MVAESWFRSLWKPQRKQEGCPEAVIGVLAFEVASLMSKLIFLWKSLSDKHVVKLREEITNSVGIRKLISDDDDYIVGLICAEMMENVGHVARAVSRLAKKCNDSSLKSFEHVFNDLLQVGVDPYGWQFSWRTMDRKAKKMERLISTNGNLYREMESLSELEHTLRSMKGNDESDSTTLVEYEKKVAWKQQELKQLKEISLWNKTYDNAVHLLVRSLFTVHGRIGHVFGIGHVDDSKIQDSRVLDTDFTHRRSHSVSVLTQSSVHPSESSSIPRFSSGPLGNLTTKSGPLVKTNRKPNFYSGPIGNAVTASSPISRKSKAMNFFSGPLGRLSKKYGPLVRTKNSVLKFLQSRDLSSTLKGQSPLSKTSHSTAVGPFKGCMTGGNNSPVNNSYVVSGGNHSGIITGSTNGSLPGDNNHPLLNSKHRYLNTPSGTLGAAALALHYANVIIVIERLVAAPHLIGHDARDDLYNMLPARVRDSLRSRLKPFSKSLTSSIYDTVLAEEWTEAMSGILEWLAPLAHNMIRWQSEKSFEHQNLVSRTNVLLVQTLYFADQEKTEATITEILVGLNYVWRFGRELNANAILECSSGRTLDGSLQVDG